MPSTQQHLTIEDVRNDMVFLKDGSVSIVIETSAVNFGLLFDTEQAVIIESFAGLLNSLSFPIQIVVHSRKLDVSHYLFKLDHVISLQQNLLLKNLTQHYRQFVESLIKDNEVLDKRFYVCISVGGIELGLLQKGSVDRDLRAVTIMKPRRDHVIRQLNRIGLKTKILTTPELVKLFYEFYNNTIAEESFAPTPQNDISTIKPGAAGFMNSSLAAKFSEPLSQTQPAATPQPPMSAPVASQSAPAPASYVPPAQNGPFVTEEVPDDTN